jgi:hypothetical protein
MGMGGKSQPGFGAFVSFADAAEGFTRRRGEKRFRAEGTEGAEAAEKRNEGGKAANLSFLGVSAPPRESLLLRDLFDLCDLCVKLLS